MTTDTAKSPRQNGNKDSVHDVLGKATSCLPVKSQCSLAAQSPCTGTQRLGTRPLLTPGYLLYSIDIKANKTKFHRKARIVMLGKAEQAQSVVMEFPLSYPTVIGTKHGLHAWHLLYPEENQ